MHMARALEGLRVRRAVLELPGRAADAIDAERAITLTLEAVGASPEHDVWWLVDTPAASSESNSARPTSDGACEPCS